MAHIRQKIDPPDDITASQFELLRTIVAAYSGVYLDRTSVRSVLLALKTRLQTRGMTLEHYLEYLKKPGGRAELHELSELLLNHETIFFRNQPHMQVLREVILPRIHRYKPANEPIRLWSAGCSTGEEPYSLAIIALETLGRVLPRPVEIWATDLSATALERARKGIYKGRTLSNITPDIAGRYFHTHNGMQAVNSEVRDLVRFDQFNLLDPFPPQAQNLDVIFCQNVTIYFELETFRNLIDRFYQVLNEGGMLFLGFSETLWNIYEKFRLLEINGSFVYMKETRPQSPPQAPSPAPLPAREPQKRRIRIKDPTSSRSSTVRPATAPLSAAPTTSRTTGLETIQRGRELLDAGKAEEMLELLAREPLTGPHAPQALALVARAHANRGDLDLAVAEARRAIEMNWRTTEAYLLLGILYAQQGQLQAAIAQIERARYLDPDAPLISFHLANIYAQMGRSESALREYQNTLNKLAGYAPETLLDGVAVEWLRGTCERYKTRLRKKQRQW